MIRRFWLLGLTGLIAVNAMAQQDKVLLENGSVIYGEVSRLTRDNLVIQVGTDNVLDLPVSDVALLKIRRAEKKELDPEVLKSLIRARDRGLQQEVHMGILYGRENTNESSDATGSFSANVVYKMEQYLQIGLGVAYDQYNDFNAAPVYFYYKGDLSSRWSGPFYYGSAGYGHAWERNKSDREFDSVRGGLHLRAGLGYRWRLETVQLELSMGWKQQKVSSDYSNSAFFLVRK